MNVLHEVIEAHTHTFILPTNTVSLGLTQDLLPTLLLLLLSLRFITTGTMILLVPHSSTNSSLCMPSACLTYFSQSLENKQLTAHIYKSKSELTIPCSNKRNGTQSDCHHSVTISNYFLGADYVLDLHVPTNILQVTVVPIYRINSPITYDYI